MSVIATVSAGISLARVALSLAEKREENYPRRRLLEFAEKLSSIEDSFYEEYNKGEDNFSDAALDYWLNELCQCQRDLSLFLGAANVSDIKKP